MKNNKHTFFQPDINMYDNASVIKNTMLVTLIIRLMKHNSQAKDPYAFYIFYIW